MSNIEKIRQKIDGLMKETEDSQFDKGERYGLKTVLEFIDSLPEEKPSEDLEKVAAKYELENRQSILSSVDIVDAFIAGAKWMSKQINNE